MGSECANMTQLQFIELNTRLFPNFATDGVFGLLPFINESSRITQPESGRNT